MKRTFPNEFLYQVFALIIAAIVVHATYVTLVRPRATAILAEQSLRMRQEEYYSPDRSICVLIRDLEQEPCFILALRAFAIMRHQPIAALRERSLRQRE